MHLETPCPRCGEKKLALPEKSGHRLYSQCARCGCKSLYIVHDKVDGSKSYSIVPVGAMNRSMVRATFWITQEQKDRLSKLPFRGMQSQLVRSALELYNSHMLQLKT